VAARHGTSFEDRYSRRLRAVPVLECHPEKSTGRSHLAGTVIVMHVSATKETCAVSSLCVYRAPEVFDQDEDGAVEVIDPDPPAELHEDVRVAARGCPTRSIRIEYRDDSTSTSRPAQSGSSRGT